MYSVRGAFVESDTPCQRLCVKRTFDAQPGSVREKIRNRPDPHTETRARINVRKPLISHGFAYD